VQLAIFEGGCVLCSRG